MESDEQVAKKRLAQIRARRRAVTFHWNQWDGATSFTPGRRQPPHVPQGANLEGTTIQLGDTYEGSDHDCAFIAAAPADIDCLLARVYALTQQLAARDANLADLRAMAQTVGARLSEAEAEAERAAKEEGAAKSVVRILCGIGDDVMLVDKVKALLNETLDRERVPAFTSLGAELLARSFYDYLSDAPNFMSAKFTNGIMVTARRETGKTPEEVAYAANAEAQELRARVQELEAQLAARDGADVGPVCQNCGGDPT